MKPKHLKASISFVTLFLLTSLPLLLMESARRNSPLKISETTRLSTSKAARAEPSAGEPTKITKVPAERLLDAHDLKKLGVLREILAKKNDNDPRMDTTLRILSPPLRRAMEAEHDSLPREKLNERATITFLLARSASEEKDLEFFRRLFAAPLCLSFTDCRKEDANATSETASDSVTSPATLLAYPEILALNALAENQSLKQNLAKAQSALILDQVKSKNDRMAATAKGLLSE